MTLSYSQGAGTDAYTCSYNPYVCRSFVWSDKHDQPQWRSERMAECVPDFAYPEWGKILLLECCGLADDDTGSLGIYVYAYAVQSQEHL